MIEVTIFNSQRAITQKVSKPDLQFSFCADSLIVLHFRAKLILTETVIFTVQRPITQKVIKADLWFLCFACHIMLLYSFARLQENL